MATDRAARVCSKRKRANEQEQRPGDAVAATPGPGNTSGGPTMHKRAKEVVDAGSRSVDGLLAQLSQDTGRLAERIAAGAQPTAMQRHRLKAVVGRLAEFVA